MSTGSSIRELVHDRCRRVLELNQSWITTDHMGLMSFLLPFHCDWAHPASTKSNQIRL